MAKILFSSLALSVGLSLFFSGCATPAAKPPTQQTFVDKLSANVRSGTSKVAAAVMPKKVPPGPIPDDAPPNSNPGPNVFVAAAQMHERSNNLKEAEASYRKALDMDSRHLAALIGYARLEDRRSNFEAATRIYRKAMRYHPKDASVHNDLGLCYHRRGKLDEATRELKRAVDLDEENKLYRNNLAAIYVEQGQNSEALAQLAAAHGKSVGHYNLGYLLMKKGDRDAALRQFQTAASIDRNLVVAQQWVAKLSSPTASYASQVGATAGAPQYPPSGYAAQAQPTYVAGRPSYTAPPAQAPAQFAPQAQAPYAGTPNSPQRQDAPMPPMPSRY